MNVFFSFFRVMGLYGNMYCVITSQRSKWQWKEQTKFKVSSFFFVLLSKLSKVWTFSESVYFVLLIVLISSNSVAAKIYVFDNEYWVKYKKRKRLAACLVMPNALKCYSFMGWVVLLARMVPRAGSCMVTDFRKSCHVSQAVDGSSFRLCATNNALRYVVQWIPPIHQFSILD